MNVHHIGYYVLNIKTAEPEFLLLGYKTESPCVYDEERKIFIQFFRNQETRVELVAPADNCTLLPKGVRKLGATPYHVCYECLNINKTVNDLQQNGFLLVRPPSSAPAIQNRQVAFLYSNTIGLIELVEI